MLNNYLKQAKSLLDSRGRVYFVMGNEASDLDSMASSVVYAWYLESRAGDKDSLYIPLINIPKEDFRLRTEAVYLFRKAGVDTDSLVFSDQVDLAGYHALKKMRLILVDHNILPKSQEYLADAVEEIIDHHRDEGLYTSVKKTIEPVGSCITLAAEKIIQDDRRMFTKDSAVLTAGTILLDTVNLSRDAGRVTPKDEQVIDYLSKEFSIERNALFEKLQAEKFNTAELSTEDILRKDYKEWNMGGCKCGFSSALISIDSWLDKDPDLAESIAEFYRKRNLKVLFVMTAYTDPDFKRELILFSEDMELRKNLFLYLQNNSLGLEKHAGEVPEDKRADFYVQKNEAYSRKKLQPVVNDFFSS